MTWLEQVQRAVTEGCRLLTRSWLLAYLTIVSLVLLYIPTISIGETANIWMPSLLSVVSMFFVQPFLKAALIGSYERVRQDTHLTIQDFFLYGAQFYRPVLMVTLLLLLIGVGLGLVVMVAGLMGRIMPDAATLVKYPGLIVAASLLVIPFMELAPIMIVLKRVGPWHAVKESYRLVGQYPLELLGLIGLFWGTPMLLSWAIWGSPSTEAPHAVGRMAMSLPFLILATPTMINYLAERIGPLESLDAPVAKVGLGRPLIIAGVVTFALILIVVMAPVYLKFFSPRLDARPAELEQSGVRMGDSLLSKRLLFEDGRVGLVTDIRVEHADAGVVYRIAGTQGAVVADTDARVTASVTFDQRAMEIHPIDVDGDGLFEYVNRGGHGWQDASLIDHEGSTMWKYGGLSGMDDMAAGDLDGDGRPEFVVGLNGSGGVRLLNRVGKVDWAQADHNVWHVEIIDTDGNGSPEIVHSNAGGQLTIRDRHGAVISRTKPREPGLYLSEFSVAKWQDHNGPDYLLVPGDERAWLLDAQGNTIVELRAPDSDRHGDINGLHLELGGDRAGYFAVLINYHRHGRAILYLYRASFEHGELLYQEVLPESSASLAIVPTDQSGAGALLVGGDGKVWRYELSGVKP